MAPNPESKTQIAEVELLVHALRNIHDNPTFEEIADILWLAAHMGEPTFQMAEYSSEELQDRAELNLTQGPRVDALPTTGNVESVSDNAQNTPLDHSSANSYRTGSSGVPLGLPSAPALWGKRRLGQALRPLMRRVQTRDQFELDEEATIRFIADTNIWMPILRAGTTRWLDLVLLIEDSSSMVVWHDTIRELQQLLENQGAFRTVQSWYFTSNVEELPYPLYPNRAALINDSGRRHPNELIDPHNQRLILVISDCVSSAWYDGRVVQLLSSWTHYALVSILHVLPPRLRRRTGLRFAARAYVSTRVPRPTNQLLEYQIDNDYPSPNSPILTNPIPILGLEAEEISSWVNLIAGNDNTSVVGAIFENQLLNFDRRDIHEGEDKNDPLSLTPHQLVRDFQRVASPTAQRLAGYFAAVPLSLPVVHLVQQRMLPYSKPSHLAEVWLSGLIRQREPYSPVLDIKDLHFDFVSGVREELRTTVARSEQFAVLKSLSDFVDKQTGKRIFDFTAWLRNPDSTDSFQLNAESEPFASIALDVLEGLGGRYRHIAARFRETIEKQWKQQELAEQAWPTEVIRRRYHETPLAQRIDRSREADELLKLIQKTVDAASDENGRSRSKRLILIEGDAGIGKTWFMEYLRERIRSKSKYASWKLAPFCEPTNSDSQQNQQAAYEADEFVAVDKNPYAKFLEVLQLCDHLLQTNCLGDIPDLSPSTADNVAEWAGMLEAALAKRRNTPILLFFDELEWWVGVEGPWREPLNHLFRVVWQMLLRQAQLPCIIIGASRRSPTFSNPMLRLTSTTYKLNGFETNQLTKLMPDSHWRQLQTYLNRNFDGNPWICQLLSALLSTHPDAWQNGKLSSSARQLLFERLVDGRLPTDLLDTLFQLAEERPNGFGPEDSLLPQAHITLKRLMDASFVDFDEAARRYMVAPVLSGLFKEVKE